MQTFNSVKQQFLSEFEPTCLVHHRIDRSINGEIKQLVLKEVAERTDESIDSLTEHCERLTQYKKDLYLLGPTFNYDSICALSAYICELSALKDYYQDLHAHSQKHLGSHIKGDSIKDPQTKSSEANINHVLSKHPFKHLQNFMTFRRQKDALKPHPCDEPQAKSKNSAGM